MTVSRLSRRSQRWLIAGLALIAVLGVAVFAAAGWLARSLPELVASRTGRQIEVRGPLEVNLLALQPSVVAHDVTIGNPPWMRSGVLARVPVLTVVVDFPLPWRSLTIRKLDLSGSRIHLVREASGRANWQTQDPLKSRRRGSGFMIHGLVVDRAAVVLDDARRHLQFNGRVSASEVAGAAGAPLLKIAGEGQLNGRPATLEIFGDSLTTARRGQPYRFKLDERSDGARLTASGVLPEPFDIRLMDATFTASGKSLRDVYRLTGLAMPESSEFSLTGKVSRQHFRATFSDLKARIGMSDVAGTLSVSTEAGVRHFESELHASVFRLRDLGKHEAQAPSPVVSKQKSLFSDTPIPLGIVRRQEGSLRVRVDRLIAGPLEFGQFVAEAAVHDGTLEVPAMEWKLDDGKFSGTLEVDTNGAVPSASVDLSIAGLQVSRLSRKSWKPPPLEGRLHARLHLDANGNSLRDLASTVDGTVAAVLPRGSVRESIAELTGVNLRGIGLALQADSSATKVRCAVASFEGTDGHFDAQRFIVDTQDVLIEGRGSIDLRSESLDLEFRGEPKKVRLGRVRSPLLVRGPLRSPSFSLDKSRLLAQTGGAALLGVALTPMAAALALVDPGLARDANCAELVGPARAADAATR